MPLETADRRRVAVVIVGYQNADDIVACLAALARMKAQPAFDVFICENGGDEAYRTLCRRVLEQDVCRAVDLETDASAPPDNPFAALRPFALCGRDAKVAIGCAPANLGYAGGLNAWLRVLLRRPGWKGAWILNPDTEPMPDALDALVARAERGAKGMVGSTILEAGRVDVVRFRGGLKWRKLLARTAAIGLGERLDAKVDVAAIELAMESPSGASMYVTRACIDAIGLMEESYFLFFEDLDWGVRAKPCGLGYASDSVVAHQRGSTTGSSGRGAAVSRLAVYLQHRNAIHFVRRHYPWSLPMRVVMTTFDAMRFLLHRAPRNFAAAMSGMGAGLRGETGAPPAR